MLKGVIRKAELVQSKVTYITWELGIQNKHRDYIVRCTQFWGSTSRGVYAAKMAINTFPVGTEAVFLGKLKAVFDQNSCTMTLGRILSPDTLIESCMLSIYPDKKTIKSQDFPAIIDKAIEVLKPLASLNVYPKSLIEKYRLQSFLSALFSLHRPKSFADLEAAERIVKFHVRNWLSNFQKVWLLGFDVFAAFVAAQNASTLCF